VVYLLPITQPYAHEITTVLCSTSATTNITPTLKVYREITNVCLPMSIGILM
jgi:hypothetical protein